MWTRSGKSFTSSIAVEGSDNIPPTSFEQTVNAEPTIPVEGLDDIPLPSIQNAMMTNEGNLLQLISISLEKLRKYSDN